MDFFVVVVVVVVVVACWNLNLSDKESMLTFFFAHKSFCNSQLKQIGLWPTQHQIKSKKTKAKQINQTNQSNKSIEKFSSSSSWPSATAAVKSRSIARQCTAAYNNFLRRISIDEYRRRLSVR
jgi:hypothetical protein